ncbi:hypothetical protein ACI2KX_10835 [Ectopseudomonas khazarica]|uniref:hypothetical protein n=1 Tax=Ectopseudomonas khazarica TaxID=2502979 RepID=UPI00385049CB
MDMFIGILIGALGVLAAIYHPEIRRKLGLDPSKSSLTTLNRPKYQAVVSGFYGARDFSNFIAANDDGLVYLDIQIDEDEFQGGESEFTLFEEAYETIGSGEKPSVFNSTGTSYQINIADSAGDAVSYIHRGFYHLRGYFAVVGCSGPNQGLMSCLLRGVKIDSIGR